MYNPTVLKTTSKYEEIEINKLDDDLLDARDKDPANVIKDDIHIEKLSKNISRLGLLEPILVSEQKPNGHYSILAGRFRTLACTQLHWKTIPCKIIPVKNKAESTAITISENVLRKDLDVNERIEAAVLHFKVRGYTDEEIKYLSKKVDNFGNKDIPESFLDALELCGYSPKYMYQIMQTIIFIPKNVQKIMHEQKLGLEKRILLTNTKLRDHPKILINLVKKMRGLNRTKCRILVNQEISDLGSGATIQQGNSYIFDEGKREKVETKFLTERQPSEYFLDISQEITRLLYLVTGYQLKQGTTYYDLNHIDNTQRHRTDLAKDLTKSELNFLEHNADMLSEALSSLLDIINEELKNRND